MTVGTVGTLGRPVPVRGDHVPDDDEDHDQYGDDGDGDHVPDDEDDDQYDEGDGDHVPGQ